MRWCWRTIDPYSVCAGGGGETESTLVQFFCCTQFGWLAKADDELNQNKKRVLFIVAALGQWNCCFSIADVLQGLSFTIFTFSEEVSKASEITLEY